MPGSREAGSTLTATRRGGRVAERSEVGAAGTSVAGSSSASSTTMIGCLRTGLGPETGAFASAFLSPRRRRQASISLRT